VPPWLLSGRAVRAVVDSRHEASAQGRREGGVHLGVAAAGAAALSALLYLALVRSGAAALVALLVIAGLGGGAYLVWISEPAYTLSAAVALSLLGGNWSFVGWPSGLPITPDRLLFVGGLAAVILRFPGARGLPRLKVRPVHWLLLITIAFTVGNALLAGTLFTNAGFFRLFDRFGIAPFVLFFVAPTVFPDARRRNVFLTTLVIVGAYLGLTALAETLGPRALVFPRYILDPSLGYHAGRARGPFLEAEANGLALFVCGAASAVAIATWRDQLARIAAGAVLGLCLLGILFTLQRAVWVGAGIAVLITLLAGRETRRFVLPAVTGIVCVVLVALVAVPGLRSEAQARASDQQSLWDRTNLNAAAVRMVEARPLFGFGWGTFAERSPPYFWQTGDTPLTAVGSAPCQSQSLTLSSSGAPCTQVAHNSYLSNAAELGLVGTVLWILCGVFGIGAAWFQPGARARPAGRSALLAIAIMWFVVIAFTPLEGPFSPVVLWIWAGLMYAPDASSREPAT
jgi:putative inorganic carbon (HCO3(-)) transporter